MTRQINQKTEIRNHLILSTAYLPPIQYFTKFFLGEDVVFDYHETFLKQSYRNRCTILGGNGLLDLTIPVVKPNGNSTKTKDILIDYATNWQHIHWKAIVSAYNQSPFFEVLGHEFEPYFNKRIKYLTDWNEQLLGQISNSLDIAIDFSLSKEYVEDFIDKYDFRTCISPKPRLQKPDNRFKSYPYYQVFSEKFGFQPNLSIIDLLFTMGPETATICKKSIP